MSFSSTLLHVRKSRANSEISELLTARRMDITVWMSSPNDEVPAVAEAGATRVARGGQLLRRSRSGPRWQRGLWFTHGLEAGREAAAGVGLFPQDRGSYLDPEVELRAYFRPIGIRPIIRNKFRAFGHPHSWPYAAGDNSRRRVSLLTHEYAGTSGPMWDQTFHAARVRMTVGGRVAVQLAAVALPWTSFLVRGLYSDTREATHHVQIIEYILGFLGPGKDGEN
ncbi:hypothetical protein EVAR_83355_1 [Eumeta japonica]|uniref:Uncharacterized protein n=1 Tax=Eumeta variegata TaxID=151549 RepID=A0A4C1VUH8_EUMVA|nr:hypothetical protein EVAR_83355_1 [Eumeta japonica]